MKKLLLVEDFPVIQDLYKGELTKVGYAVDVASDGMTARNMVGKIAYDIILLDMLLPELNGIEFLESFKKRPAQTKIIALSDFSEPGRMKRARELGVMDYLIKADYPPSKLIEKLEEYGLSAQPLLPADEA